MKTKLFFFALLCFSLFFGQNRSLNAVDQFSSSAGPNPPIATEIFRFRPGLVTQIQDGTGFGFSSTNRWFSLGDITQGTQNFYGLRLQSFGRGLTMGYTSASPNNPRIEWIGNGAATGNLEFRVGTGFGAVNSPGINSLVATMTNSGNTIFGTTNPFTAPNTPLVGIVATNSTGLSVISNNTAINMQSNGGVGFTVVSSGSTSNRGGLMSVTGGNSNIGLAVRTSAGNESTGIESLSFGGEKNIGIKCITLGQGIFEAAVYGETPQTNANQFAAYFDGQTFSTTGWAPSDAKLKENVKQEENVLERLSKLSAVTYDYKNITELNLPRGVQHGFIAQELSEVFPELTQDIKKPVFDKDGKIVSTFEFKSVNYTGLISVLTASVNELNSEVKLLKEEIESLRNSTDSERNSNSVTNKVILEQNIPNPFSDRTTIKYQLPQGTAKTSLIIFDMNGGIKKEFPLTDNKGEITVTASQIGKGLFIYSLVQNGQILETKKMMIIQ